MTEHAIVEEAARIAAGEAAAEIAAEVATVAAAAAAEAAERERRIIDNAVAKASALFDERTSEWQAHMNVLMPRISELETRVQMAESRIAELATPPPLEVLEVSTPEQSPTSPPEESPPSEKADPLEAVIETLAPPATPPSGKRAVRSWV